MFSAFRISCPRRARHELAGPSRALRLAVLLLALLYTHGVNGHNADTHASPVVAVTAAASTEFGNHDTAPCHHDGDEAEHGSESCASGQPQYRADLPARGTTPLCVTELTRIHVFASTATPGTFPMSCAEQRDPGILRV
ncbi:hypothetical protein [Streptomyces sp. IB2014 016-6]|uniref:hypothetical protein n=1 Tax=Streptomyces sp. IB2014 016-6 TaxID=2517818 RepID=UPI0011CB7A27|nr:hypothetical protein [Streptomyces sp. IB2014 016-6]TXL89532.1 hypothetical protein EW053_14540 [Streptomyces sp. IB2014 016-6]